MFGSAAAGGVAAHEAVVASGIRNKATTGK